MDESCVSADKTSRIQVEAILKNPEDMLDRHLRLTTVKCQTAELLLKVQVVQNALQRSGSSPVPRKSALILSG